MAKQDLICPTDADTHDTLPGAALHTVGALLMAAAVQACVVAPVAVLILDNAGQVTGLPHADSTTLEDTSRCHAAITMD